jgi:hypothetical protein
MLTQIHFTFSLINSLHTAVTTQLKLPYLLSVHNDIILPTDCNLVTGLLLLDLSSAFDTVVHSVLLCVLNKQFCITDTAFN